MMMAGLLIGLVIGIIVGPHFWVSWGRLRGAPKNTERLR